ncbi:MAG TPA: cytochrome c oxidase subunit II [Rhizomicrobium sp.]
MTGASGAKAGETLPLTWGVIAISVAVMAIIAVLLALAIWRRPGIARAPRMAVGPDEGGANFLWIGVAVSTLALLATIIWTVKVLAEIGKPPAAPGLVIEVTAHQWWWEVRYLDPDARRIFTTANEIHIPTGTPVQFKLIGGDVIHSFWIPALSGKTDMIPGQTNELWLEADKPGTYRGQCSEYCGLEHAKMAFVVVADTPRDFAAWRSHQIAPDVTPGGGVLASGAAYFRMKCGSCHAVRGSDAAGVLGPDLSHFATRQMIAAGVLANTPQNLSAWIEDPQGIKPGNLMQKPELSAEQRGQIVAYLETLK